MRLTLDKLMEKLGVDHTLSPYETQPWVHYQAERGITCSAEVRMGPGGEDVEAEIQFLHDNPETEAGAREQIMHLRALPVANGEWSTTALKVKGEDYENRIYDWEGKGCDFFRACVQALQMGELPDIDALIEQELDDDGGSGGRRSGRIGRKSPKIKPAQLLGIKKPM